MLHIQCNTKEIMLHILCNIIQNNVTYISVGNLFAMITNYSNHVIKYTVTCLLNHRLTEYHNNSYFFKSHLYCFKFSLYPLEIKA